MEPCPSPTEIDSCRPQSQHLSINIVEDALSLEDECSSEETRQDPILPEWPLSTTSLHTDLDNLCGSESGSIALGNVTRESFQPILQPSFRHFSIGNSSFCHSRSSTPTDDKRRLTGVTWTSTNMKEEIPSPIATGSFKGSIGFLDKEPGTPTDDTSSEQHSTPTSIHQPGPSTPNWSKSHEWAFIFCVCLAQFLSLASLAQTVAPLLIIGKELKVQNPGQLSWFTAAFSMTLGTFILPAGRIGDMFGHKKIFILGWLWLALWSFIAGFAHTWGPIVFSAARGIQGIAPAFLVPNAMALIGRTFPIGDKRAMALSLFGACGPTGFLAGAAISSFFAQVIWWPWAFWATAISALFITFFALCIIPDSMSQPIFPPGQSKPAFDYLGCFTGVTGLLLINFSLNQAPLVGWKEPYVYFLLVIGVMITCAFFFVELYRTNHPLVPMRGLQPQAIMALACIAAGWASHGIWIYYFYLFLMRIRNLSPLHATLQLFPVAPLGIAFALSTNYLIKRIHVSKVMLLAMIFFLVGTIFLAFAPADQSYWAQTFLSVIIMPGGMNLSFPAGTILLSNAMPREHQGKAASLVSTIVNYSIASGLGIAGTIEQSINPDGTKLLQGYRGAWQLGIGFSGLGVLISIYFVWTSRKA